MIEFTIPGEPKGKGRPRHERNGHTYTPRDTKEYEEEVRIRFRKAIRDDEKLAKQFPLTGPVKVTIWAYFKIPKSITKKRLKQIRDGEDFPTKKPDIDNIEKIIEDALNGLAYKDDSQIVEVFKRKIWTPIGAEPQVVVWVGEA